MSAAWGGAGAQHGAAHERCMGLRMSAAWGCARAPCGAAQERCVGLRMGCAKGRAWGGGGGAPHHRLLATPPGAGLLTRRLLGPGPACARGPHHRLLAPRCRGGRAGGPFRLVPPGAGSVVHGHRPAEAVSYGAHVGSWPRAHGGGSQLSPPEVLAGCPWGGGGMRFRVFWEASYLPWQNPGGLFALGNLRWSCRGSGGGAGQGSRGSPAKGEGGGGLGLGSPSWWNQSWFYNPF